MLLIFDLKNSGILIAQNNLADVYKLMLARLQVRITFLSPALFIFLTFAKSFGSINGPFFNDRDIF